MSSIPPPPFIAPRQVPKQDSKSFDFIAPDDFSSQEKRIQNRIKHLEILIKTNIKSTEELSKQCYTHLRTTELLAFNLLLVQYITGTKPIDVVFSFIEKCLNFSFDLNRGSQEDFDQATIYVESLNQLISEATEELKSVDFQSLSQHNPTSEILHYLKKMKIQKSSKQTKDIDDEIEEDEEDETFAEEFGGSEEDSSAILTKWLQNELKIKSEEDIEMHCLIKSIATKLANISSLRNSIFQFEREEESLQNISYLDCDIETLYNSPFYVGLKNSIEYLEKINGMMSDQEKRITDFLSLIDQSKTDLGQKASEFTKNLLDLKNGLSDYMRYLNARTQDTENYRKSIQTKVEDVDIQQIRNILGPLDGHNDLENMIDAYKNLMDSARMKCQTLFDLITKTQPQVIDHSFVRTLKQNEVSSWIADHPEINQSLGECIDGQKKITDFLKKLDTSPEPTVKMNNQRKEIERLSSLNYQLCVEIAKSQLELETALEEQYKAQKELAMRYKNQPNHDLDRRLHMATCPICKINRRNVILFTCGHPFCKGCITQSSNHLCPICQKSFSDSDVRPFILQ